MPISLRSYTPRHATPRHVVCPPAGCNVGRIFLSCRTVSANDVASHPRLDIKLLEEALGRLQQYVLLPGGRGRLIFMRTCISMVPLYPLSCMLPPGICGLEIRTDLIVQTISPADRLCHCNRTVPTYLRALWKILQAAQRHAGAGSSFPSARDMKKAEYVACGHRTNVVCIA